MGTLIYIAGIVIVFLLGCVAEYLDLKDPEVQSTISVGDGLGIWFIIAVCWPLIAVLGCLGGVCFAIFGGLGYLIKWLASLGQKTTA